MSETDGDNEVLHSLDNNKWMDAIKSELDSINEKNVWTVVERPNDKSIIKNEVDLLYQTKCKQRAREVQS